MVRELISLAVRRGVGVTNFSRAGLSVDDPCAAKTEELQLILFNDARIACASEEVTKIVAGIEDANAFIDTLGLKQVDILDFSTNRMFV